MKKITKIFLLSCTCFHSLTFLKSQVSIYTFSQGIGTYSPITGGTVFGTTTSDDQVFLNTTNLAGAGVGSTGPGIPIGFSFIFNGISYDRFGINTNGFIYLGQSTLAPAVNSQIANAYVAISSTSTAMGLQQQKISGLGLDLQGQTTSTGIRAETIGAAPNLTTVIQWSGFRRYNYNGDNFNFQIRLNQTTNVVEVVYGTFVSSATSATAQIGLRGQTNTDFNTRFVNAINTWSVSAPGNSATTVVNFDNLLVPQNGLTYKWTPPLLCNGLPAANNVLASLTTICPGGSSTLSLANTYTNSGLLFQWLSSTTASNGAFAPIPTGLQPNYLAGNVSTSTWYKCAITCTNGGAITYAGPLLVSTIGSVVSTVPYQEDFENILIANSLPNCSWATSASTAVCQTYTTLAANNRVPHTGNKFAAFKASTNVNGDYFYTNAIKLYAGITYSASVWYITDGNPGWLNFSMSYGTTQSPAALTPIASVTNINAISYQQLAGTFTVASTGNYFIALKCTGIALPLYFSFDDLSVTAPCNLNGPVISVTASSSTLCSGNSATLSVSGANTYTWTGGIYSSSLVVTPSLSTTYYVIGTNTLSACSNTISQAIVVNPSPLVNIVAGSTAICAGQSATLTAAGATSYSWDTGSNLNQIVVSPLVNTVYTLTGSNNFGCQASFIQQVAVLAAPNLVVAVSPTLICEGQTATLTASGADTYEWKASSLYSIVNPVTVMPFTTTTYSIAGTNSLGCVSTGTVTAKTDACLQVMAGVANDVGLSVFPNPFSKQLEVRGASNEKRLISLLDGLGRLVGEWEMNGDVFELPLADLESGMYYLRATTNGKHHNLKIVKE